MKNLKDTYMPCGKKAETLKDTYMPCGKKAETLKDTYMPCGKKVETLQIGNVTLPNNLILAPMAGCYRPAISHPVQGTGGGAYLYGNG